MTLYLPVGLIASEKLLILESFLHPNQLNIEFVHNSVLITDPDKPAEPRMGDITFGNMSFDSSDGRTSNESGLRSSLGSSIDVKSKKYRREEKRKKSEFDRNNNLNKVLDRQKLEKSEKTEELVIDDDIKTLKQQKPVLKTTKGTYILNFSSIVLTILNECTLKYPDLRIADSDTNKFRNYMLYINRKIDYNVNKILYELYNWNKIKKQSHFNNIDKFLKVLLHNLEYFESFVFVKDSYIFGESFSVVDLMLLGAIARMFVFFFDERIREGCLELTTKWLKSFLEMDEIKSVYGDMILCIKNYILHLGHLPDKNVKTLKLADKKYEQEFTLERFKGCLQRLVKLRKENRISIIRKKSENRLPSLTDKGMPKQKTGKLPKPNTDIYKDSDKITDLNILIRKLEETVLKNLLPDDYSLWIFDYIKEDEDTSNFDDDSLAQSSDLQIDRFYTDILEDMQGNAHSIVGYLAVYSNCEELNKEEEFIGDFEFCKNHPANIFLNKNLKGFIVKKGHAPLKFMTSYESLDQVILTKVNNKEIVTVLKDFINGRGLFSMEMIYKEVVV